MGGPGSGRPSRYRAKRMVNYYRAIDIRKWSQEGVLIPGTAFTVEWTRDKKIAASMSVFFREEHFIFNYRYKDNNQWKDTNYAVNLDWSLCNLGGKRPWFFCPTHNCERRVAI